MRDTRARGMRRHSDAKAKGTVTDEERAEFDGRFLAGLEQMLLFNLILAANFLNIKGLMDLTLQSVAEQIKGKSPEELRAHFRITNDFTPEQEAEVRRENAWNEDI